MTYLAACRSLRTPILLLGVFASVASAQGAVPDAASRSTRSQNAPGLALADVLRRVMEQHPVVDAARARVSSARGGLRTARTLPNPVFSYWAENIRSDRLSGATSPLDRESQTFATLPLEPLFQRWPRIAQADADVRAADADLALAGQRVALDAARAFFRVAAAQVAVDAADDIRQRLAVLVTFNQARVREGVAAEGDLIRTQLELDRVAANVTSERVELARARALLRSFLAAPNDGTRASGDVGGVNARSRDSLLVDTGDAGMGVIASGAMPTLDQLVAQARVARPDLVGARARAEATRADVRVQRALTLRQFGATFGTKRSLGVTSFIAGVSLPVPLFDQNRGEVQRAAGENTAADYATAWVDRQAVAEIEAALESARLLTEQVDLLRGSFLERADESRRIALAAYQEGAVSLLQVIDASRTLAEARVTYYRTVFAQQLSLLELNAAVGASLLHPFGARP